MTSTSSTIGCVSTATRGASGAALDPSDFLDVESLLSEEESG